MKIKVLTFLILISSLYFLFFDFKPPVQAQIDQINPRLVGIAGQYTDSKGASHQVEIWAITNIRSGRTDYFVLALPSIGSSPYPVIVFVNPYAVFPSPPSSNPEDSLWTGLAKRPGPYYDVSLPEQDKILNCSTPTGECPVVIDSLASLSNLPKIGSGFGNTANSHADWALTNGYAFAVAFARHYAARDTITVVYTIHNTLVALKNMPTIDGNRIGITGVSQGGHLSIHSLAIPDYPLSIAAAVAESPWIDGRKMHDYYFKELSDIQPPAVYTRSRDFVTSFFNRFFRGFGSDLNGPLWNLITVESVASRFNTPVLLIHGSDDIMIPVSEVDNFYTELKNRGKTTEKWVYKNGLPPLTTRSALEGAHGLMDDNSSVKRRILTRNFFLQYMPPNIPEVTIRDPQEVNLVSMLSEFKDVVNSSPAEKKSISDFIVQAANPKIKYVSSDPRIPTANGPEAVVAAVNTVWADEGINWTENNVISNLQQGLLPGGNNEGAGVQNLAQGNQPIPQSQAQNRSTGPSWWPLVPCGTSVNPNSCTRCDLFKLTHNVISFILYGLVPPVAAVLFILGGLFILLGGARPEWVGTGKKIFWNTFIGLVIILASWMIVNTFLKSFAPAQADAPWYRLTCKDSVITPGGPPPPPSATVQQAAQALINAIGLSSFSANADCGGNFHARQNIQDMAAGQYPAVCSPICSPTNPCLAGGSSGSVTMNPALLDGLRALRNRGIIFTVTSLTTGKHSPGSSHYSGHGVDFVISNNNPVVWIEARTFLNSLGGDAFCETAGGQRDSDCSPISQGNVDHIHWTR